MLPCLTLSIIRYGSRVKWSNPGNGFAPSSTPQCSSYWKGSLQVTLGYGCQLYLLTYTGCSRNTSHILNLLVCSVSKLWQVIMVAPPSYCLTIWFIFSFMIKTCTNAHCALVQAMIVTDDIWTKKRLDIYLIELPLPFALVYLHHINDSLKCGRYFCHIP